MKLASLISGGKDSIYATYLAMKEGHEIKYLVTMFPERQDSWMFHHPCVELTKLQSKALGIKQIIGKTKGEKEKELEDLEKVLEKIKAEIEGIVTGSVASSYQKARIDRVCEKLELKHVSPLWNRNAGDLLSEEVESGFEIIITSVSTDGLGKDWLGKKIDSVAIKELKSLSEKYKFNLAFEGGEAETFVCNGPIFNRKIIIESFDAFWDEKPGSGYIKVKSANLSSLV